MIENNNSTQQNPIIKDYNWVLQKIDEIEQNIQYLLEILACYADAFLKVKETIEKLHDITLS